MDKNVTVRRKKRVTSLQKKRLTLLMQVKRNSDRVATPTANPLKTTALKWKRHYFQKKKQKRMRNKMEVNVDWNMG